MFFNYSYSLWLKIQKIKNYNKIKVARLGKSLFYTFEYNHECSCTIENMWYPPKKKQIRRENERDYKLQVQDQKKRNTTEESNVILRC